MQTSTADNSRQSGSICPTSKSHLHALKYISMPRRRRKKRNSCVGMCGIPLPHWLSPEKLFRFLVSGRGIDTLTPRQTIEYSEDKSLQPALPVMISSLRLPLRRLRSTRYCRSIIQPVRPAARAFHAAPRAQPYMVGGKAIFGSSLLAFLAYAFSSDLQRLGKAIFARAEPTPMEKHFGYALVQASDVYHFRLEE
ncbi:hypothetical protein AAMO2058_000606500 [Amorphochlora amoebiformis]